MADDSDGFTLLDDEGRLFGLVNIIDMLVVLLVLAVVVAGAALLLSGSDEREADTRHATIDLGNQPDFVAEQITTGDTIEPEATSDMITITDVYRFDTGDGTGVVVRATINGTTTVPEEPDEDPVFQYRDESLQVGQQLAMNTTEYAAQGTVTRVQRSGETLPRADSELVVQTTVSDTTADEVSVGDEYRVAGEPTAEITDLQQFPAADDGERSLLIGLSAATLDRGGTQQFGGTDIRIGNQISFVGDGYELSATIVQRGTNTFDVDERQFLIETTVTAETAADITEGDQYRLSGTPIVTVESKTTYATSRADVRRVILGVSAVTRDTDGTVLFGDRELRTGQMLPVRTGEYDIDGEIIRRGTLEEAGEPATRTATLSLENIRPDRADAISVGQAERIGDRTTAEITAKETEPAEIILESDDGNIFLREHPRNVDVDLQVELQVRELEDGSLRFRGDSLRTGDTVTLELGQLRIQGTVSTLDE